MALPMKQWSETPEVKKMRDENTMGHNMTVEFFRDPQRSINFEPDTFYAPADGIVLYALPKVNPDEFLEIKGENFTLKQMLNDPEYNEPSLVVGIFMTTYDVHINRVPISSYYMEARDSNFVWTHNISMLIVEHDLFKDFNYDPDGLSYLKSNEKKVSVFRSPRIKNRYYIVQVGDKDVDVIQNWHVGKPLRQGERFGAIRWGSQCDLVIPLNNDTRYEIVAKKLTHVEAGIDPIVRVKKGKQ